MSEAWSQMRPRQWTRGGDLVRQTAGVYYAYRHAPGGYRYLGCRRTLDEAQQMLDTQPGVPERNYPTTAGPPAAAVDIEPGEGVPYPTQEETDMAKVKKAAQVKKPAAPKKPVKKPAVARSPRAKKGDITLAQLTQQFNDMVPSASKKVPWAKHHVSNFGSRDQALKQIKRLKDAVAAA